MSELQALLLCGGPGSRMTELCISMMKCLLPVANVPMFWYPLKTLVNSGVKDIKIFVREDGESEISRLLATPLFSYPSATIEVIAVPRENEEWGTADLLRHYSSRISHDFIVMSCDFVSDCRLQPMIDQFRAHRATLLCLLSDMCVTGPVPGPKLRRSKGRDFIALEESKNRFVYMTNEEDFDQPVNADAWLTKFSNVTLTARYIDCHVYFMRHSCLDMIVKQKNFTSLKADFIPYLLSKQCSLSSGDDEVPKCMAYLLPHGNATVSAHVNNLGAYLEINKSVLKCLPRISSKLYTGRVFDGRATGIHTNESLVAADAEVAERVLIKRSVIASQCTIKEKANIQGSVLMKGATIGKGFCDIPFQVFDIIKVVRYVTVQSQDGLIRPRIRVLRLIAAFIEKGKLRNIPVLLHAKITQSIICCGAVVGDNAELSNVIVTKDQKVSANVKIQNEVVDCDDEENGWENDM